MAETTQEKEFGEGVIHESRKLIKGHLVGTLPEGSPIVASIAGQKRKRRFVTKKAIA